MANSVQRKMDEAQLLKPCTSFSIGPQAFTFSKTLQLCFSPTRFKSWEHFRILQQRCVVLRENKPSCISHSNSMWGTYWKSSRHTTHARSQKWTGEIQAGSQTGFPGGKQNAKLRGMDSQPTVFTKQSFTWNIFWLFRTVPYSDPNAVKLYSLLQDFPQLIHYMQGNII